MDEKIKILCVDDEQNVLNALKRLFIDNEYVISTALSGQDGLKILEREHAHVIISDYRMPGMNGVEFLKEVCSIHPDTVRIVLSGYADAATVVDAINEGQIYKFVPKPWNDNELKITVANAIERYFLYKKNKELADELQKKNEALTELNFELEKLLEERTANLEFRSRVLASHQNILDSIPVGILGIDMENLIVLHNSMWVDIAGSEWFALGQSLKNSVSGNMIDFIEEVKSKHAVTRDMEINGIKGRLLGSLMDYDHSQKGVILAFVREDSTI